MIVMQAEADKDGVWPRTEMCHLTEVRASAAYWMTFVTTFIHRVYTVAYRHYYKHIKYNKTRTLKLCT